MALWDVDGNQHYFIQPIIVVEFLDVDMKQIDNENLPCFFYI